MNARQGLMVVLGTALALVSTRVGAAPLGDNLVRLAPSPFKLPQNIGPLRYAGENRYRDRRMGRSFAYSASGISLSIYVYDYGIANLPDGPDSIAACEQYESAKREIERGGNYENVVLRAEVNRSLRAGDSHLVREASYEFDRNGIHAVSVLWLTAADGYFMKLRLSLRAEVADELDDARVLVLESVATALAAHPLRPPVIAVPPPQEASVEVDAGSDVADAALWLTYAVELTRYAREHPEIRPPCGGRLVPGYAAELSARRAALHDYLARPADARVSSYFDALARVDAAGYLDEYVWYYLRDPQRDVTPPAALKAAAFELYRQAQLATHVAQSGAHVRIDAVRVLPLQPAP